MSTLIAALAAVAIVAQDQTVLRAAPRDSAQQQAVLWQGDSLEIRGEKGDYLQVYDYRRERGGYIRTAQVRTQSLQPESAPELLSIVRFLRDAPGAEALGIAYTAAYLKAAPAEAIDAEPFAALGAMADRLAHRASARQAKASDTAIGAHLEVAAGYGVRMVGFERDGQMQTCYDGDAFQRVLALPASDVQRAQAALGLTAHECVPTDLTPLERGERDTWRGEVLDRVETAKLPDVLKNRVHMRKAGVWAGIAHRLARRENPGAAAVMAAGNRALEELAAVNPGELAEADAAAYSDAAVRVGASRWAAEPAVGAAASKLSVAVAPGQPGEPCVQLFAGQPSEQAPLLTRCTYGVVWIASATPNADGTALALAVQPMDTWRELWVFRKESEGWRVDVVPPALGGPDTPSLGYVEFAGWTPDRTRMLAAREAKTGGRYRQSFESIRLDTLETEKRADKPSSLSVFYRWQDPAWKRLTVSLR